MVRQNQFPLIEPIVGYRARVQIGLQHAFYHAAEYEIRGAADDLDVSNYEDSFLDMGDGFGDGFRRRRGGLEEVELHLRQATWDAGVNRNPHQIPFAFRINRLVPLVYVYPDFDRFPWQFYLFPCLLCLQYETDGSVQTLQPFDAVLRSDGPWFYPDDVVSQTQIDILLLANKII